MLDLGAVPAQAVAHPREVALRALESNAGFMGPQKIAEQSQCPASAGKIAGGRAPLNLWALTSQRESVPSGPLAISGSLQGVAMNTPVPTLAGAPINASSGLVAAARAGQSRHFTQQFFADQLTELQQRPDGVPLGAAPTVCQPQTFGAWFGAQQEVENRRCATAPHGFNDGLYACGSRPAAAIRGLAQARPGVGMI